MNSIGPGPGPPYRGIHHHHHSPGGAGGLGGSGGGGGLGPINSSPSSYPGSSPMNQKPKVGLAVVCRAGNNFVQCLLQRRGMHSASPNKWSFPGGRLEQAGDLEDDGAVGTKRELNEECGGGAPPGLPPLIHIECCKTGKQSQTLYHVYVVDTSHDKEWELWQPKARNGKSSADVDTVVNSLKMQGQAFPCINGYCWVDMSALVQECFGLGPHDLANSDLQHGLVRWVQNYGEHILKILIARSPKLPHPRRLPNPITTPPSQNGHMSPRQGHAGIFGRQDSGGKPRRFNSPNVRGGMLQPPYHHGQFNQHNFHLGASPSNSYYSVGPGQLSPPSSALTAVTPPSNSGLPQQGGYPGGLVLPLPPGAGGAGIVQGGSPQAPGNVGGPSPGQAGLMYHHLMMPLDPSSAGNQQTVPPPMHPPSTQPSSPVLSSRGVVSKSESSAVVVEGEGGGGGGVYMHPHHHQTQGLISSYNPLMATSATVPPVSNASPSHPPPSAPQLSTGGQLGGANPSQFEQPLSGGSPAGGGGGHPGIVGASSSSVFPLSDSIPATVSSSAGQFLASHAPAPPPLTISTPLPHPSHPPLHPVIAHTPQGGVVGSGSGVESEPLLPNPPLPPSMPLLPLVHPIPPPPGSQPTPPSAGGGNGGGGFPQQPGGSPLSSRKEILCRHYMLQGVCPFGEKCWFAHPEPISTGAAPLRGGGGAEGGGAGGGVAAGGIQQPHGMGHVQLPPNFFISNPSVMAEYTALTASPPQSPLNPALLPRSPLIFRPPRGGGVAFPGAGQQPPLFLLRNPLTAAGNLRMPASNLPLIPPPPIPPQVNPILKFTLLSQVVLQGFREVGEGSDGGEDPPGEEVITDISQLATFADHFFVSYGSNINTYKIIFGGSRAYQDSAVPIEKKRMEQKVSCLICSQLQPMLLLVGTEEGCVSLLDMRKGAGHGVVTQVQSPENSPLAEAVSALIHFPTSINSAQVVVTGTQLGSLAWHISQPPQKTFSRLFLDQETHTPNKILSLQMLGGFLVSGDASGKVVVWSMMSQTPSIHCTFSSHSLSLVNLHVVDASHFLTVGADMHSSPPPAVSVEGSNEVLSNSGSQTQFQAPPSQPPVSDSESFNNSTGVPPVAESLNFDLSRLSLQQPGDDSAASVPTTGLSDSSIQFSIKWWEYGKPPKLISSVPDVGAVISSSFHCHSPPGNMFLGLGLRYGVIKIYNIPTFTIASELHFPEMKGHDCTHIKLNLSREVPVINHAYYRNPFRDLILTSVWSDGKVMVCQVAKQ